MPRETELFEVLQALDEYLAAQGALGLALRDGSMNLARAKYALGTRLGRSSFPGEASATARLRLKSRRGAAGEEQPHEEQQKHHHQQQQQQQQLEKQQQNQHKEWRGQGNCGGLYGEFEVQQLGTTVPSSPPCCDGSGGATGAAGADAGRAGGSSSGSSSSSSSSASRGVAAGAPAADNVASGDALTWFAALPPPSLRAAQADYVAALRCAVAAANAAQRLRARADELCRQQAAEAGAASEAADGGA
jgi:hypothetical protein